MARRTKAQDFAVGFLIVLGLLVWGIAALNNAFGTAALVTLCGSVVVLIVWANIARRKARIAYLMGKYGDPIIVDRIMRHNFWQGQTAAQLEDSLGQPYAKDDKCLKTFKREVWKYNRTGKNRYALRITLENDIVAGWDQKN
jgi:hypothetical protein